MGAKNCPETPRQKMINMMYLVLTAMLALNVSSETLEAFRVVNSSLLKTIESFTQKNKQVYTDFENAYKQNQSKVEQWKNMADEVKTQSDSLVDYITQIKVDLALGAKSKYLVAGESMKGESVALVDLKGDTIAIDKQDDLHVAPNLMINQGRGEELRNAVNTYKAYIAEVVGNGNKGVLESIEKSIDVSDPEIKSRDDNKQRTWVLRNFETNPLVAVLTILSNLQIDIRNAESIVLNHLFSQIDAGDFKFNSLEAQVIPTSSYITQGEEFEARIFLSAVDTTKKPEVFVGNRKLDMIGNQAIYKARPTEPGFYDWGGTIKYKSPDGEGFNTYKFNHRYQVAKPSVTISPTAMNVMYKGLQNPISVSAAGIPADRIRVDFTNGNIKKSGESWIAEPDKLDYAGKGDSKVRVYAKNDNGTEKFMGEMIFRVKEVPLPVASVMTKTQGNITREEIRSAQGIYAELKDFEFDLKYTVTEYNVTILSGGSSYAKIYSGKSNLFTEEIKTQFKNMRSGTIYISDIIAKGEDGSIRTLAPISLTVR